ncbi:MAG: thermonuclease family protein [Acidobacteria bacterium]|nr:thermonuclease family protein [Acidobacteriota bacterium]
MAHGEIRRDGQRRSLISSRKLILLLIGLGVVAYRFHFYPADQTVHDVPATTRTSASANACGDSGDCFSGPVTRVIDGDTLDIADRRVRLVLVDAPERDTSEGPAATQLLARLCQPGTLAAAWPDARQPRDNYGRTLAVVRCGDENVNARMIRSGHAQLYRRFCRASAFGAEPWARKLGCP